MLRVSGRVMIGMLRVSILRAITITTVVSLLLACIPCLRSIEGAMVTGSINVDHGSYTVEIITNVSKIITITGNVTLEIIGVGSNVQDVLVALHASNQMGWPNTVSPETMIFQASDPPKTFSLQVLIPGDTINGSMNSVQIAATATCMPGLIGKELVPATVLVNVITLANMTIPSLGTSPKTAQPPSLGPDPVVIVLIVVCTAAAVLTVALILRRRR